MLGIFLLLATLVWLAIAAGIAWLIARAFPAGWRFAASVLVFLALIPLPIIDELLGKRQFEELCRANSAIQIDRAKAAGRTVYLANQPKILVEGTWLKVALTPWRFVDAKTSEVIVSYNTVHATKRFLHITEGGGPLTFNGYCAPSDRPASVEKFKKLGINYIERPAQ